MNLTDLDKLMLGLAIVALVLAIAHMIQAAHHSNKLKRMSDTISTRYLGKFPKYILRLSKLLSTAKQELLIVCVLPTHGVFTCQDDWLALKHAIETALSATHRLRVVAAFADKIHRQSFIRDQFRHELPNWDTWRRDPSNRARLRAFVETYGSGESPENLSAEQFLTLFEVATNQALKTTFKGAEILEIEHRIPLYMWIADAREAIFVIPTSVPTFVAHAFWTEDADLISALIDMHKEYQAQDQAKEGGLSSTNTSS